MDKNSINNNDTYSYNFYSNFSKFVYVFMKLLYRIEVTGLENIPEDQNYILAGNHLNILDSWLLITLTKEHLRFMVDQKLYNTKLGRWFFKKVGTFDVDTSGENKAKNQEAIKKACKLLKSGEKIVIFPEGQTHPVTVNVPFKDGAPIIAKLTNTVLVPFGIHGRYLPFSKININFGEPINFKELKLNKNEESKYLEGKVRILQDKHIKRSN